ncbi:hypothetical protein RDWZM_003274 [Blomia tropicalis]|uniref:Uncharacterized protein n=1 Tax=Blomia tropicalis TaxID=40697 RepID=A0A9Q0MF75_BLOTA|nr:hypothetical protein BLOT_000608 [Blomia tropicalis]KAJ6224729.1 hypothetical protein RDWZM_003274 [Blomia tropicalis]
MEARNVLIWLILIGLFANVLINAQQRRRPNRRRKPSRNKKDQDVRLNCYTCYADFEKIPLTVFNPVNYIYTNLCYNPAQNFTMADHEYLTRCASSTKYCMVDITRMNDVLLSVDRRCGGSTCRKTCLARGYGVIRETCTFCCGGRIPEDDPEYDEDFVYKCPTEPH